MVTGWFWMISTKKGKILQLFLSTQSGLARNKRPLRQCLLIHISTFHIAQMQIGHKFEPETLGSMSGFPSSSALWNILLFCRAVNAAPLQEKQLWHLSFASALSQQLLPVLLGSGALVKGCEEQRSLEEVIKAPGYGLDCFVCREKMP